ncbi:hypothetical protein LINPERPRIM_LOCUS42767 [Linum perenne]
MATEEREGRKIGRAELFMETHMREDGSTPSGGTDDLVEQVIHNMQDPTVDEGISQNDALGRCLSKKKSRRVCYMGHGKTPKRVFKTGASSSSAPPPPYCDPDFMKKFGMEIIAHLQRAQLQGGLSTELMEMAQVFTAANPESSGSETRLNGSDIHVDVERNDEENMDENED